MSPETIPRDIVHRALQERTQNENDVNNQRDTTKNRGELEDSESQDGSLRFFSGRRWSSLARSTFRWIGRVIKLDDEFGQIDLAFAKNYR